MRTGEIWIVVLVIKNAGQLDPAEMFAQEEACLLGRSSSVSPSSLIYIHITGFKDVSSNGAAI